MPSASVLEAEHIGHPLERLELVAFERLVDHRGLDCIVPTSFCN